MECCCMPGTDLRIWFVVTHSIFLTTLFITPVLCKKDMYLLMQVHTTTMKLSIQMKTKEKLLNMIKTNLQEIVRIEGHIKWYQEIKLGKSILGNSRRQKTDFLQLKILMAWGCGGSSYRLEETWGTYQPILMYMSYLNPNSNS